MRVDQAEQCAVGRPLYLPVRLFKADLTLIHYIDAIDKFTGAIDILAGRFQLLASVASARKPSRTRSRCPIIGTVRIRLIIPILARRTRA